MGLSARRPQLPMLRMPNRQNDPYNSIIVEQQDDAESPAGTSAVISGGNGSGNMLGGYGGFSAGLEVSPSTPVTPLPGTPIPYDKCSQSGSTPVTPGFANAINPFSFSFTSASTTTSSSSSTPTGLLLPGLKRTKSGSSESSMSSMSSGMHTPGAISPLGGLGSGFNFGGGMKRSRGFGMGEVQRVKEDEEVVWEEREVGILESFLLNPLRPLSTPYPPGTLPPSEALDELTSQILHFHRPTAGSSSKKPTLSMSSSQSAPSLKDDAVLSKPVRPIKHRRTTSASGIPWKHSWQATRRKLYEIARKEARGDSREDRYKGRADIKSKAFLTAAGVEVGPFSPMILEGQDVPGGVVMDDGHRMQFQRTGSEIRLELGSEMKESFFPYTVKETRTTIGPVLRASTSLQRSSRFNPTKPPTQLPVAPPFQARPASLLQRGKSFTAEDFNAALTLSSSPASSDRMQVEVEPLFPDDERSLDLNLNDDDLIIKFPKPSGHFHNESFDSVSTIDSDMNAPATPETTPGITLTSPSPSRNRAQQMKEMGSPTPGSNTEMDGASFGEVLTIAPPKSKLTRPSPMARSRSTTGCHRGPSAISQFMLGNGFSTGGGAGAGAPHVRSFTEGAKPDQAVLPQAKRLKLTLDMPIGSDGTGGLLGPALASPFEENKKF